MVWPYRKKRSVVRYEQEFLNQCRGHFNLDDFEGEDDLFYCLFADDGGEQASTYDKVMMSKNKKTEARNDEEWNADLTKTVCGF